MSAFDTDDGRGLEDQPQMVAQRHDVGIDVPEADALEQQLDRDDIKPLTGRHSPAILEADEADVLDQDRAVPFDEDDR